MLAVDGSVGADNRGLDVAEGRIDSLERWLAHRRDPASALDGLVGVVPGTNTRSGLASGTQPAPGRPLGVRLLRDGDGRRAGSTAAPIEYPASLSQRSYLAHRFSICSIRDSGASRRSTESSSDRMRSIFSAWLRRLKSRVAVGADRDALAIRKL
jgi:hypothetical protein